MRFTRWIICVIGLATAAACLASPQDTPIKASDISVEWAGTYDRETGWECPRPTSKSTLVSIKPGTHFGVCITVKGADSHSSADFKYRVVYPAPGRVDPRTGQIIHFHDVPMLCIGGVSCLIGYEVQKADSLPGIWRIELYSGENRVLEQEFVMGDIRPPNITFNTDTPPAHWLINVMDSLHP